MARNRTAERAPAYLHARVPADLYEAVDAYAETFEIGLSEAIRRLLVAGLGGMQLRITDEHGTRVDESWKLPPASDVADGDANEPDSHRAS